MVREEEEQKKLSHPITDELACGFFFEGGGR
jgi:hypothetical protein